MARMWALVAVWLALLGATMSLRCPDGHLCKGLSACCPLPGGAGYTCCNLPEALETSLPMVPVGSWVGVSGTICPDGSQCPTEYSCLRTSTAAFACCPWTEAVSCTDGLHCCPLGSHCSADGRACFHSPGPADVGAVQCPDGESECPNDSTCCVMPSGAWGCCPMPEAACCADKIHCCPHATTCDLEHARCLKSTGEQWPLARKLLARKRMLELALSSKNTCPDQKSTCPDDTTCCQMVTGQYGCCHLQNAVCCSDHLHCCPQSTICDLARSRCTLGLEQSQPLARLTGTAGAIPCDSKFTCPDGNTCCRKATGAWGCCPLPEAECCQDHVHCCPKGYQCDPAQGACLQGGQTVPWLEKALASPTATFTSSEVQCDEKTSCPNGDTCCRMTTGAWGCCPLQEAVCCQDHVHCCPKGYHCDPAQGSCLQGDQSIPWLEKAPASVTLTPAGNDVKCDDQMSCLDGQTCCLLPTGAWACCTMPEAVCCTDHKHCCPKGYSCDTQHGTCIQSGTSTIPWLLKAPAQTMLGGAVRCDEHVSCADGQTCCLLPTGAWGCCHFPEAVCCEDHQHCCPWGYTCNVGTQTCEKRGDAWLFLGGLGAVAPLLPSSSALGWDVACDAQHYCRDRQTCCQNSSGGWACCPYNKGSCCADKRHCCPFGFRCSRSGFECLRTGPPRWDAAPFSHSHPKAARLLL
uniref:Granulin n=1 Tax=Sphenodon punctatus TaxID=8508 RepID=A0A8D0H4N2_SPHPU